jgi:SMP-30/Gluconolactonase/LRE-like region
MRIGALRAFLPITAGAQATGRVRKLVLVLAAGMALAAALPARAPAALPCTPWSVRTITSGAATAHTPAMGSLENVVADPRGYLFMSATDKDAIFRMTPDGQYVDAIPLLHAPGGLLIAHNVFYYATGDDAQSGLENRPDGTIRTVDFGNGNARATYASGLTMPDGLAMLPNGDLVVSRSVGGSQTGITLVPALDPAHPRTKWASLGDTSGMAVDPTGSYLYVDETRTSGSYVYRVRIDDPSQIDVVASFAAKRLDDMTIDGLGVLYIAANDSGEIVRLDPRDGSTCVIASGLGRPSAVKFGAGNGFPTTHLFVVGFDGAVRELAPPSSQEPSPPPGTVPPAGSPGRPTVRPRITLTAQPRSIKRGRRTCVRFTARAERRSVRGARVRFAHKNKKTNSRGRAVFCVRPRRGGTLTAYASKPGMRDTRTKVLVRAR